MFEFPAFETNGCVAKLTAFAAAFNTIVNVGAVPPPAIDAFVVQFTFDAVLPMQSHPVPPLPFATNVTPVAVPLLKSSENVTVVAPEDASVPKLFTINVS